MGVRGQETTRGIEAGLHEGCGAVSSARAKAGPLGQAFRSSASFVPQVATSMIPFRVCSPSAMLAGGIWWWSSGSVVGAMGSGDRHLPSGTVTMLFTDVEGSTRLLRELGASRYAEALMAHRERNRTAAGANGGVELGTEGDAFFFVFQSAGDCLAASTEMQRALADGP